jgi:tetratricopeptide (TPR) repeat protein
MHSARFGVLAAVLWAAACPAFAQQSDARQRQAAAEAYDQGTAAYLSGDYEKAAEWFETANRMSPAAPALIQAARAHQQAGHQSRAATLALRIVTEYPNEAAAVQYAQGLLDQLAAKFVRVDVACDGCTIDVDGTLQESQSFFVEPDQNHSVTASFETGERKGEVSGSAGESKTLEFTAPPPPPHPLIDVNGGINGGGGMNDNQPKPLPPYVTFIGAGVTAALLGTAIWSRIDTNNGVDPYKTAAGNWKDCLMDPMKTSKACEPLHKKAQEKYDDGQSKETRTTVLWVATGAAAAATGVIALFFTNWSDDADKKAQSRAPRFAVAPTNGGAALWMKGQF